MSWEVFQNKIVLFFIIFKRTEEFVAINLLYYINPSSVPENSFLLTVGGVLLASLE